MVLSKELDFLWGGVSRLPFLVSSWLPSHPHRCLPVRGPLPYQRTAPPREISAISRVLAGLKMASWACSPLRPSEFPRKSQDLRCLHPGERRVLNSALASPDSPGPNCATFIFNPSGSQRPFPPSHPHQDLRNDTLAVPRLRPLHHPGTNPHEK